MPYKRKTEPGRELDFFEAVEDIYHEYYVYFKGRPTHPGYMCSMSLQTIRAHCSVGDIRQCLSTRTGRPYAKYHVEECRVSYYSPSPSPLDTQPAT